MQRKREQEVEEKSKGTYVIKSSPMTLLCTEGENVSVWCVITENIYFPLNGEMDGMSTF